MGSSSAARDLRFNQCTPIAAPHLAKVIPFKRREPLQEMPKPVSACSPNQQNASIIQLHRLFEAKYEQKEKGVIRRAAEPPSDHYLLAWVVWLYYLNAYTKAGLRVSEESRRLEIHQKSVCGLGK